MKSDLIENRQIRIFISSTFRDMMAERDHLVTKVFPSLRRYCAERDVSLVELDLRWGISEEESKQGKVVDICLKEIQNTTPFFIGLLGERYGWVPSDAERKAIAENTSVFEEYPWIGAELSKGTSITEIEIQQGVLHVKEKVDAYFYFRSPVMETPDDYKEKPGSREAKKLAELKTVLRHQKKYPIQNYDSIESLGDLVEHDFKALVDTLFPEGALSKLEKERLEQRNFLKSHIAVYIQTPAYFEALDAFVQSDERAFVVSGESGMGKSALLANWIKNRQAKSDEKMLYHFIGNSRSEGDYRKITERLINEIKDIYGIQKDTDNEQLRQEASSNAEKQKEALQNLLFSIAGKLIIVLDGMDHLANVDNAKLLNWLPAHPKTVKVIYSASHGDTVMDVFTRRDYKTVTVEALPLEQRKTLAIDYLKSYGKTLLPAQIHRIAADKENENPLVLRILLDELRVFGVHEEIDKQIDYYLAADNFEDFFNLVLERLEKTYNDGGTNFVQNILSLIAVSRAGLSETEILELSGAAQLYWSQLYNGITGHVTVQNDLVAFSHRFMRNTAKQRYFLTKGVENEYRKQIAAYMESASVSPNREYDEMPYQLYELKDWDALYTFLLDFDVFDYIVKKDIHELGKYWRALLKADKEKYTLEKYLELAGTGLSKQTLAIEYGNIGFFISEMLTDYSLAQKYNLRVLAIQEEALGKNYPDTADSYNNIGSVYSFLGDYSKAMEYHRQALEIREEVLGKNHPDTAQSYNNIGGVYNSIGNYPEALEYLRQALKIQEEGLGKNHPHTATLYNNIGEVYRALGNYPKALEYLRQALEIFEEVLGENHPAVATLYNNIGEVYRALGNYPKALEYYRQALEILEEVLGKNHPHTAASYNNIGLVYDSLGEYPKALEYFRQALEIFEEVLGENHPDTAALYNNIGLVYKSLGNNFKAMEHHRQALEIQEGVLGKNHSGTAISYGNIGEVYRSLGNYPEALEYYRQALAIQEDVLGKNHPHTAVSYNNIGLVYDSLGDYPKAMECFQKALEICEEVLGKEHPDTVKVRERIAKIQSALAESKHG